MASPLESRPPAYIADIESALADDAGAASLDPAAGEFLRTLAASRPGGVCLSLGPGSGSAGAWILDGIDLSGRLVVLCRETREADGIRPTFEQDLRATVHTQSAEAFLGDVGGHRFDLIVDLFPGAPGERTVLALGLLAPGGGYLCRQPVADLARALSPDGGMASGIPFDAEGLVSARLADPVGLTLVVLGAPRPPARRRGGRRSRQRVTPLFASRGRGGA